MINTEKKIQSDRETVEVFLKEMLNALTNGCATETEICGLVREIGQTPVQDLVAPARGLVEFFAARKDYIDDRYRWFVNTCYDMCDLGDVPVEDRPSLVFSQVAAAVCEKIRAYDADRSSCDQTLDEKLYDLCAIFDCVAEIADISLIPQI